MLLKTALDFSQEPFSANCVTGGWKGLGFTLNVSHFRCGESHVHCLYGCKALGLFIFYFLPVFVKQERMLPLFIL